MMKVSHESFPPLCTYMRIAPGRASPLVLKDSGISPKVIRSSNDGAERFQEALDSKTQEPLFVVISRIVNSIWESQGNCVGVGSSRHLGSLRVIRELCPALPILLAGIGAQGGDLSQSVRIVGGNSMISSSRGIVSAGKGEDFAEIARKKTLNFQQEFNKALD